MSLISITMSSYKVEAGVDAKAAASSLKSNEVQRLTSVIWSRSQLVKASGVDAQDGRDHAPDILEERKRDAGW